MAIVSKRWIIALVAFGACGQPLKVNEYEEFTADKRSCQSYADCSLVQSGSCNLPCIDSVSRKRRNEVQEKLTDLSESGFSACKVDCIQAYPDCKSGSCVLADQLPQQLDLDKYLEDKLTCKSVSDCTVIEQKTTGLLPCQSPVNVSAATEAQDYLNALVNTVDQPNFYECTVITVDCIDGACRWVPGGP